MTMTGKGLSKKQKTLFTLVAILAIGGVGTSVYASQAQKQVSAAQTVLDEERSNVTDIKEELQTLLDPEDDEFLAKNVTNKKVKDSRDKFDQATKKVSDLSVDLKKLNKEIYVGEVDDVKQLLDKIDKKLAAQNAVNKLYQSNDKNMALNGSKVTKDLAIVDNLKKETIESVKKEYLQDKKQTTFDKAISDLVTNAENQLKQIDAAKTAVAKVYKDEKVVSTDSKLYDEAKAQTDKIKNEKAKKALFDQLAKVKSDIDKKAKEEAEKVAADQAAQQQAQAQSQVKQEEQAVVDPTNQQAAVEQNQGSQAPTYTGGNTEYQAPAATGGNESAGYQPPATNGGSSSGAGTTQPPATGGNGQGVLNQDQMNQAAEDASQMDPTKDPNSPWYNK